MNPRDKRHKASRNRHAASPQDINDFNTNESCSQYGGLIMVVEDEFGYAW